MTHTHAHRHTTRSIRSQAMGPHPVITPANMRASSCWQPSKRSAAAGEGINILWLEHEDVFILLCMSNDGSWKPKTLFLQTPFCHFLPSWASDMQTCLFRYVTTGHKLFALNYLAERRPPRGQQEFQTPSVQVMFTSGFGDFRSTGQVVTEKDQQC